MGSSTRSAGSKIILKWVNDLDLRKSSLGRIYGTTNKRTEARATGWRYVLDSAAWVATRIAGAGDKDQTLTLTSLLSKELGDRQLIDWIWCQMAVRGFSSTPPFPFSLPVSPSLSVVLGSELGWS